MASTYFDWLAGKIAQHAKIEVTEQGYDSTALTRLADAAAALRNPAPGAQAFGLSLPPGGVDDAEVLVKRCLEILRERTALLEPEARRELSALLQRLGLDAGVSGPEMAKPRTCFGCCSRLWSMTPRVKKSSTMRSRCVRSTGRAKSITRRSSTSHPLMRR